MKKMILSLIAVAIGTLSTFAQDDLVATLNHGTTLTTFMGEDALSQAYTAAAVTTLGTAFKGTDIVNFDELKYFTSLTIIAESAFEGCSQLRIDSIPAIVTSIGNRAFYGCSSLTSIFIPATVTEIGTEAFAGCDESRAAGRSVCNLGIRDNLHKKTDQS